MAFPLSTQNSELAIYPQDGGLSNGQDVPFLTDYSGKGRNVSTGSAYPKFSTPAVNGKAAVVWDGTSNPLKNAAIFTVACGFMVVKINEASFSNYAGILTDTTTFPVLVGHAGTTHFYDNLQSSFFYEFRTNDRIYSRDPATRTLTAPAPMNVWRIIFFRYWKPVTFNGIQIGQDRSDTSRKAKMSLALLALYSQNDFCEEDIRANTEILAAAFNLTLADVYPFQADADSTETPIQPVNFYDPPEGDRISETLGNSRRVLDLQFSARSSAEKDEMLHYHSAYHAPALPLIYRDYKHIPRATWKDISTRRTA